MKRIQIRNECSEKTLGLWALKWKREWMFSSKNFFDKSVFDGEK